MENVVEKKINRDHITINVLEEKDDDDKDVNPYIRYFINDKSFRILFSAALTMSLAIFCMIKLITLKDDTPQFTTYITILTSLNTLWVPIQMLKNKKRRIMWK